MSYSGAMRQLDRLWRSGTVAGLSEWQLLDRFATKRDEVAFEALVARHGPMVLGVCQGLLRDPRDVEDAFQATFLVLSRKAGSLRESDVLGRWLHGVALRVAKHARAKAARRGTREVSVGTVEAVAEPSSTPDDPDQRERIAVLHEELGRLPSKYRDPIVLCYLEGLSHESAADRLGWPVGTVKGRLARAREYLRQRLSRRGVTLPASAVGVTLTREATAAVSPMLVNATIKAALGGAGGKALVAAGLGSAASATAVVLADGVLKTMFLTKLKTMTAGLAVAGALVGGAGVSTYQAGVFGEGQADPSKNQGGVVVQAQPAKVAETREEDVKPAVPQKSAPLPTQAEVAEELEQARAKLAQMEVEAARRRYEATKDHVENRLQGNPAYTEHIVRESTALMEAERKAARNPAERIAAARAHLDRVKELAEFLKDRSEDEENPLQVTPLQIERLVAEAQLLVAEKMAEDVGLTEPELPAQVSEAPAGSVVPADSGVEGFRPGQGPPRDEGESEDAVGTGELLQAQTQAIQRALNQVVPMPFPNETPLEDVIEYLKQATVSDKLPQGIPIYLDPVGLNEMGVELPRATVTMNLDSVRLRTTLRLLLNQLGLAYTVKEGLLIISSPTSTEIRETFSHGFGFQ